MEKAPTYEEFYAAVRSHLKGSLKYLSDDEIDEYINEEDDYIPYMYDKTKKKFENGEIGIGQFRQGIPATIGYEMAMSY